MGITTKFLGRESPPQPKLDLSHPLVVELSREFRALDALPISTKEERKVWSEAAESFEKRLRTDWASLNVRPKMLSDEAHFREKLSTTIRGFRRFGLVFFTLSCLLVVFFIYAALNPTVPFRIHSVESHDIGERVRAAAFSIVLPMFASFFAFCPRAMLERLLRYQFSEMEKMKKRLGVR